MSDQSTPTPPAKRGIAAAIAIPIAVILVLLVGSWLGALAFYAPDADMIALWGQTLDEALAKNRPVLVKAGSKW